MEHNRKFIPGTGLPKLKTFAIRVPTKGKARGAQPGKTPPPNFQGPTTNLWGEGIGWHLLEPIGSVGPVSSFEKGQAGSHFSGPKPNSDYRLQK